MAGLVQTGLGYENQALSGFVRLSAQEEQQKLAEEKLKAQERAQTAQMIGTGASIGISIALLAASLGDTGDQRWIWQLPADKLWNVLESLRR